MYFVLELGLGLIGLAVLTVYGRGGQVLHQMVKGLVFVSVGAEPELNSMTVMNKATATANASK